MVSKTRIFPILGGCIVVLLILTGCQPDYSSPETIEETVLVIETVEAAQPTVEQQTIKQTLTGQGQPTTSPPAATLPIVESASSSLPDDSVPKILLLDRMADWDGLTYTRLIEIAASKGVEVDLFDKNQFIVDDRYDGIIVFGGGGGYDESISRGIGLWTLFNWATGHRFVFFVLPGMANYNASLWGSCWTFCVRVASEYLTPPGKDVISVPGIVLSELWSGLEIGSKTAYDEISIQTYFESPLEPSTSMSNLDGVQRKTSVLGGFNSGGEYLFISSFVTGDGDIQYRNSGNFLHDGNIDGWDNQRAVEILIDWLVGIE